MDISKLLSSKIKEDQLIGLQLLLKLDLEKILEILEVEKPDEIPKHTFHNVTGMEGFVSINQDYNLLLGHTSIVIIETENLYSGSYVPYYKNITKYFIDET